ncbi:helical backbone metal receptor [Thiotrichales bacterium 19S3-7]|nr:helical backbone metal receptor [Thiotrichales bacterium 19S3-7]MCF6802379.1 helical backbone metal receptor [Thiotrichales bacterium 19S3-11]
MIKQLAYIIVLFICIVGYRTTYAINVITLAPNITRLIQSIIEKAHQDGVKSSVNIIATVHYVGEPKALRQIPSIGDAYRIQLEKIILLKPDLVIAWQGGTRQSEIEKMRSFKIHVVEVNATSLASVVTLIIKLGNLIGLKAQADQMAKEFYEKLKQLQPLKPSNKAVFVQLSEYPLYTIGGKGFMDEIISFCGGENIYQAIEKEAFEVSFESVILKNPDIILVTQNLVNGSTRPLTSTIWQQYPDISAVKNKRIYAINSNNVSQATLDLLAGVQAVCKVINE